MKKIFLAILLCSSFNCFSMEKDAETIEEKITEFARSETFQMHAEMMGEFFDVLIAPDEQEETTVAEVWNEHKEPFLDAAIKRIREEYDMKKLVPAAMANDNELIENMKSGLEIGMRAAVGLPIAQSNFETNVNYFRKIYGIHKAKKGLK